MSQYNRFSFEVYPHETDCTKHITLTALGCYILNAAGLAAKKFNFGMDTLHSNGMAWVTSRLSIKMDRLPMEFSKFTIETFVGEVGNLFTTRHYRIFDEQGDKIGAATSIWAVIDMQTRHSVNLTSFSELSQYATKESSEIGKPKKIDEVCDAKIAEHIVVYSDIDMNQHVNSFKYIQWMLDTLSFDFQKENRMQYFEVNYIKEALCGESVSIHKKENEDGTIIFDLKIDDKSICRAKFTFVNR